MLMTKGHLNTDCQERKARYPKKKETMWFCLWRDQLMSAWARVINRERNKAMALMVLQLHYWDGTNKDD